MNNQDIALRLQNIIDLNRVTSKQLALKEKRVYKKLHFLANTTNIIHQKLHEKNTQLMMAEKLLSEHQEVLSSLQETQASLRHQIARLQKKISELKNLNNQSESITPDDRYVYTKNAVKKSLLGECLKIRFNEIKKPNRTTLLGYVCTGDKLYPFEKKIPNESKQTNERTELWEQIKFGSEHLNEWENLFADDGVKPVNITF